MAARGFAGCSMPSYDPALVTQTGSIYDREPPLLVDL
jgi:hypothetical protein